ncbi:glycoside hydrolase family 15 protein [Agrococcus sp. TSP3-2-1]|uniref:glycoside hydrolase family 15 protein n=1 Tax=Agrococcus sp. TSP3-2-1 TaxID=2804583 RepID=UPI003CF6B97B
MRVGNGAASQFQADVVGEVMVALPQLRAAGEEEDAYSWAMQKGLLDYAEANLDRQDHGIWEMRGDLHCFTHGRAMLWAGFDCGVRAVEEDGLDGPVEHWRELRERLREEIDDRGFDAELDSFTQQLVGYANDLGLMSEEYDPDAQRLIGNFPQAFSHLALIRATDALRATAGGD